MRGHPSKRQINQYQLKTKTMGNNPIRNHPQKNQSNQHQWETKTIAPNPPRSQANKCTSKECSEEWQDYVFEQVMNK